MLESNDKISRQRANQLRNPDHAEARQAVSTAVKSGKLPRPETLVCYACGDKANQYHHHKGYHENVRLDVAPICQACHNALPRPRQARRLPLLNASMKIWVDELRQFQGAIANKDFAALLGISEAHLLQVYSGRISVTLALAHRIVEQEPKFFVLFTELFAKDCSLLPTAETDNIPEKGGTPVNSKQIKCLRCGHTWQSRTGIPKACPSCKSYNYRKPRQHKET